MDAQRSAVAAFVTGRGGELAAEFVEVESGRKNDRPQLAAALDLWCRKRAVLVIVAEYEREMILQRTWAALAAAKATKLGYPRIESAKASAAASVQAARFRLGAASLVCSLKCEGRTLQSVADESNTLGVKTTYGRQWHPSTVRGMLIHDLEKAP